jgi:hypothetical protein
MGRHHTPTAYLILFGGTSVPGKGSPPSPSNKISRLGASEEHQNTRRRTEFQNELTPELTPGAPPSRRFLRTLRVAFLFD